MDREVLIRTYPTLYHMAEHGSWPGIRKLGLLSTSSLLDLFEISGKARHEMESKRRLESVQIRHPIYGEAVVRDQKPLSAGVRNFIDACLYRDT